jgi:hypothetical protein
MIVRIMLVGLLALSAFVSRASEPPRSFRLSNTPTDRITIRLQIDVSQHVHSRWPETSVCAFVAAIESQLPFTLPLVPLDFYDLDPLERFQLIRSDAPLIP